MEYYTYILYSEKDQRRYVGSTEDVLKRLNTHNAGMVTATKYRTPFRLLFYKKFQTRAEAMKYERFLKSLKGGTQLKKIIEQENNMPS